MTGTNTIQKSARLRRLVLIVIVVVLGWYILDVSIVKKHVPEDSYEKQYEVAKQSGSPMERCVLAELVAETYSRNKTKYEAWRKIAEADCGEAGL